MATITIRNLPDDVRDRLRVVAAQKGRSMEAEARAILAEKLQCADAEISVEDIAERIREFQKRAEPYLPKDGRSLVDDFLAERRAMWGED